MKIEIPRFSAWMFIIMFPLNFVILSLGGLSTGGVFAVISMAMFYLMVAAPMVISWWEEEQAILRIGNMVEWTDTKGVVRKGKLLGQYKGNWLIDWVEPNYSRGALPPNELRKVKK